jgi:hypothetical protein
MLRLFRSWFNDVVDRAAQVLDLPFAYMCMHVRGFYALVSRQILNMPEVSSLFE